MRQLQLLDVRAGLAQRRQQRLDLVEVLDAQRTLLAAETLRIAAARDARLSIVDFAKALGGGWSPETFAVAY